MIEVERETICALASGRPPSAIAVIRISGPAAFATARALAGRLPSPRHAALRALRRPENGKLLDRAMVSIFPGPRTVTGEDVAELHLHGGAAVIDAVLRTLLAQPDVRLANPGEFTRRAFDHGKLDLTQAEALGDLLRASTEAQRAQAVFGVDGALTRLAARWREGLLDALAAVEAELDFSDEADTAGASLAMSPQVEAIGAEMNSELERSVFGERVRDGLTVVLLGAPNVGKSSLLNALAKRDVSIVASTPGTTRDLIEVTLDLGGVAVTLVDTAGLRDSDDPVEAEGVRRARNRAERADLVLALTDGGQSPAAGQVVRTKIDLDGITGGFREKTIYVSAVNGGGLAEAEQWLAHWAATATNIAEPTVVTNARQRSAVTQARHAVATACSENDAVLRAEAMRSALTAIAGLTRKVDVEEVLDRIFSQFCIGK